MHDRKGADLMLPLLPRAKALLADRAYDAARLRNDLLARGITPCIPSKTNRRTPIPHDTALFRLRARIEISFGRLKDWRRIATRYDRCADLFLAAVTIAAIVLFWL